MMLSAGADDKSACGTAARRQIAKESKLRVSSGCTPLAHDTVLNLPSESWFHLDAPIPLRQRRTAI